VIIVGASAHGSPGVTTTLEIMAAVSGRPSVLVEFAAGGGSLAARHTLPLSPGMAELSEALRRGEHPDILNYCQALPSGVPVVALSPSVSTAKAQMNFASAEISGFLRVQQSHDMLVDAGLVWPGMAAESLLPAADLVLWFVRPLREEVAHLATRLNELPIHKSLIVVVGKAPYAADEIGEAVGRPARALDFDARGAEAFRLGGADRKLRRSILARSITTLSSALFAASERQEVRA